MEIGFCTRSLSYHLVNNRCCHYCHHYHTGAAAAVVISALALLAARVHDQPTVPPSMLAAEEVALNALLENGT